MRFLISSLVAAFAALLLNACAPQSAAERAYVEQKKAESAARQSLKMTLSDASLKDSDVISAISSNAAPDSNGTTDDWLKRQLGQMDGQVLFPRWRVIRYGGDKYGAQYTFNVIDSTSRFSKHGYEWSYDAFVRRIGAPKEMTFAAEQQPQNANTTDTRQQDRILEEEASLE